MLEAHPSAIGIRCLTLSSLPSLRIALLLCAAALVGCNFHPGTTQQPPAELTLPSRIDAIANAERLTLWQGDLDGDGHSELVLSVEPTAAADAGGSQKLRNSALAAPASDTSLVFTYDPNQNLTLASSNATYDFSRATALLSFDAASVASSLGNLLGYLKSLAQAASTASCDLVLKLLQLLSDLAKAGTILVRDLLQILATLFDPWSGEVFAINQEDFQSCLDTPQTLQGCLFIGMSRPFDTPRNHCYQVPGDTPPVGCPDLSSRSTLCDKAADTTGCCNRDFAYQDVMLLDLRNMSPFPVDPPSGPIPPLATPQRVILGTPLPDTAMVGLFFPKLPVCLAAGVGYTRNPIVVGSEGDHCAVNIAQPGHIFQGQVEQCLTDDDNGVYSTIIGTGVNTYLSAINEAAGPTILATVRDHLKADLAAKLSQAAAQGITCNGAVEMGPDGGVINPTAKIGTAWGDPHLVTQDGNAYNFQYVGEFLLAQGNDGAVIQVRQAPYLGTSRSIAMITAVAANVAGQTVEIDARLSRTQHLWLNGVATSPGVLPNGGRLDETGITWPDGTRLQVGNAGQYLNLYLYADSDRSFLGLLGDRDHDPRDDFRLRDGTVLPFPLSSASQHSFSMAWRISQSESLFHYDSGQSTTTFTDLNFPYSSANASDLAPATYASANATCVAAGVTDPILLDACILDVGTTGDATLAGAAAQATLPLAAPPGGYQLDIDPQSMKVDKIGVYTLTPDGRNDGVFTTVVQGPVKTLSLRSVNLSGASTGQVWDTTPNDSTWALGVEEDGVLLNNADSTIALPEGLHHLRLYADNSGYFVSGVLYRLFVTAPDGTTVYSPIISYVPPQ